MYNRSLQRTFSIKYIYSEAASTRYLLLQLYVISVRCGHFKIIKVKVLCVFGKFDWLMFSVKLIPNWYAKVEIDLT